MEARSVCGGASIGREVSEGEKGVPEALFRCTVIEGGSEGRQDETGCSLCPGEPGAWRGVGEGVLSEWMVECVDLSGRCGADCDQSVRFGSENFFGERIGGGESHVGLREVHGLKTEAQGLQNPGVHWLLDDHHDP